MNTVVLLSTRRLPPTYFDQVREDLGDQNITIDVVGWVAPSAWVADKVNTFTLIGPGRMPAEPVEEPSSSVGSDVAGEVASPTPAPAEEKTDVAQEPSTTGAAGAGAAGASGASTSTAGGSTSTAGGSTSTAGGSTFASGASTSTSGSGASAAKARPTGAKRVVKAVEWRARRARKVAGRVVPKAIKTSAPVKFLRGQRASNDLGKTYWDRVLSRRDVLATIDGADVVVALDAGAIWAGWNLGQRKASTPVVLGLPAARREFDQLKLAASTEGSGR
ncbi:hypothetical protein PWY87_29050 [Kribbella solani]|uniref:hypothetical protein n=1 Tax=Kribbella solani TaxID=236067 RepID=UPI0029B68177|nr:hypothetical protein [Kribbella solani]MDX3005762.1 hypothetical protein [Kribbella solani]